MNEAIHLTPTLIFSYKTAYCLFDGNYGIAALNVVLGLSLGIGPILIQRYNRARLYNLIEKMEAREKKPVFG